MRYFIYLYPYLAIFSGIGISQFLMNKSKIFTIVIITILFIWPLMFLSIYTQLHTRVDATKWIYTNIPTDKLLLNEHWDDGLPVSIASVNSKNYRHAELPVFDADTNSKWQKMDDLLKRGDYLILSSNRGWGSISQVPMRYARMSQFYKELFAGRTRYKMIKEFTSYPSLRYLGIPLDLPDQWSDESFTVYDHPKVIIFKGNP